MRRRLLLLVSLLLALPLLTTACASFEAPEPADTITTSPPPQIDTGSVTLPSGTHLRPEQDPDALVEKQLAALPESDMQEANFLILTTRKDAFSPELVEGEEDGRRIDMATLERNRLVQEKYNVTLMCLEVTRESLEETISDAVGLNMYLADLLELPSDFLGTLVAKKLSVNLQTLPNIDYTRPYFNQSAIAQLSAGNSTYGVVGNANAYYEENLCLYFRADMLGTVSASALYRAAYAGEWTWSTLLTLAEHAPSEIIGIAIPADIDLPRLMLATCEAPLLSTNYGAQPIADSKTIAAVEQVVSLTNRMAPFVSREATATDFANGDALFYVGNALDYRAFAEIPYDWGILPLPKRDMNQRAYHTLTPYQTFYTAVATMSNPGRTGLILQALNAATGSHVTEYLIKDALQESVRCADAANMLALALGDVGYDFGYMMQNGFSAIKAASVDAFLSALSGNGSFEDLYLAAEGELVRTNGKNFPLP